MFYYENTGRISFLLKLRPLFLLALCKFKNLRLWCGGAGRSWSYLIWSAKPVQCWWHSLQGATRRSGNMRDMGGRLIRRWWGERRDMQSDWSTVWISASTEVQSGRFLLGLVCSFNSSLSPCVQLCACATVCVCVCARCSAGGRQREEECVWLVYSWTTEDWFWTRDTWPAWVLQCRRTRAFPWRAPVDPLHFMTSWHVHCLH